MTKDLNTEAGQIENVNQQKLSAKVKAKGFGKNLNSVAGSIRITDSAPVAPQKDEATPAPVESSEAQEAKVEDSTPATPAISLDQVQDLIKTALGPLQSQVDSAKSDAEKAKEEAEKLQRQLDAANQELQSTKTELDTAKTAAEKLADLGKLLGKSAVADKVEMPMINTVVNSKSDAPQGAVKDFLSIADKATRVQKLTGSGSQYLAMDTAELNRFAKQNRNQLIADLESYGKANGLLQGGSARYVDAATARGDIPGGFLDVLSAIMRTNNRPGFIFWQFPTTKIEFDKGLGDTVKIPRAAYQPGPSSPDDRLLSGAGVFYPIDPGNQNIQTGVVSAVLQEYGLGKNSQAAPIALPTFIRSYSMIDLMSILERNLQYDYYQWEDLIIRALWAKTSRVVYNDKGNVTALSSDLATGDGGQMTEAFLTSLYAYMRVLQIPTFMDGRYGLAANSIAVKQLKADIASRNQYIQAADVQALTEVLNPTVIGAGEVDRVTGLLGAVGGFWIFDSNSFGCGAPSSVLTDGVRTETINSTSMTTRSSYAFGADTIGRGIGTEMQIVQDEVTNFGRLNRFIWRSEESHVALDVDPTGYSDTSNVPQQLRILDVRVTDVAV